MRDYGTVHTSFWTSDNIRRLSDDGRILALYLLSGPHTTSIGCFRLPDGYVSEDLGWSPERVAKGFDELFRNGFATRDERNKWVLVSKFLKWNEIENPNQGKAAAKLFDQVPTGDLKDQLSQLVARYTPKFPPEVLASYERVREGLIKRLPEPFRNQEQEQEQETVMSETKSEPESPKPGKGRKAYPEQFEQFWKAFPTDALMSKQDAGKAWAKLDDNDRLKVLASVPAFLAYCRKNPEYRPVHAVRYLTQRRFDGFAAAPTPTSSGQPNNVLPIHTPDKLRQIAVNYLVSRDWPRPMAEPGTPGSPVTTEILSEMRSEADARRSRMFGPDLIEGLQQ